MKVKVLIPVQRWQGRHVCLLGSSEREKLCGLFIILWCATLALCICGFDRYTQHSQRSHQDLFSTFAFTFKLVEYPHLGREKLTAPFKVINSAMAAFILETMAQHGEPSEVKSKIRSILDDKIGKLKTK